MPKNIIIRGDVHGDIYCHDYSKVYALHKDVDKKKKNKNSKYMLHIGKGVHTQNYYEVWYRPDYGIGKEIPTPERFSTLKEAEDFVREFYGIDKIEDA